MRFVACPEVWNLLVDPQQLENVILNLSLNASNAMPSGGTLLIQVDNICKDEGEFVHMAFTDTGHGMPADVKARAFEPFFSTKGIGKGTGLGLSMAYGFGKQSGGHIDIDSEAGRGTTIHILRPVPTGGRRKRRRRRASPSRAAPRRYSPSTTSRTFSTMSPRCCAT